MLTRFIEAYMGLYKTDDIKWETSPECKYKWKSKKFNVLWLYFCGCSISYKCFKFSFQSHSIQFPIFIYLFLNKTFKHSHTLIHLTSDIQEAWSLMLVSARHNSCWLPLKMFVKWFVFFLTLWILGIFMETNMIKQVSLYERI